MDGFDALDPEYCSGLFSDVLDKAGFSGRVVTGWQQNRPDMRLFGRARTVRLVSEETDDERIETGLTFLASLGRNDVLVVEGSNTFAYFGELMTRLSLEVGIAGVVIEGLTRDTYFTRTLPLQILARAYSPVDIKGRGRVEEVDRTVRVGHLDIAPGDILFADGDALVAMTPAIYGAVRPALAAAAEEEAEIKRKIERGATVREILNAHKAF